MKDLHSGATMREGGQGGVRGAWALLVCLIAGSVVACGRSPGGAGTHQPTSIAFAVNIGGEVEPGLYLMDAGGQNTRQLVPLDPFDAYIVEIVWSPDGEKIAYALEEGWPPSLWVVELQTGNTIRVADEVSPVILNWSPDSQQIVYLKGSEMRMVNADGSEDRRLAEGYAPVWSPDGEVIAYNSGNALLLIRPDGSEQVSVRQAIGKELIPWGWSPDGEWILITEGVGVMDDIVLVSRDGSEQVRVTNTPNVDDRFPRLSPDGQWVAYFNRYEGVQECEIVVIRKDGSDARRLTADAEEYNGISWSPDSQALVYATWDGEVIRVEIASGEKTTLTAQAVAGEYPVYAP